MKHTFLIFAFSSVFNANTLCLDDQKFINNTPSSPRQESSTPENSDQMTVVDNLSDDDDFDSLLPKYMEQDLFDSLLPKYIGEDLFDLSDDDDFDSLPKYIEQDFFDSLIPKYIGEDLFDLSDDDDNHQEFTICPPKAQRLSQNNYNSKILHNTPLSNEDLIQAQKYIDILVPFNQNSFNISTLMKKKSKYLQSFVSSELIQKQMDQFVNNCGHGKSSYIGSKSTGGLTALINAATNGDLERVKALAPYEKNMQNFFGINALLSAITHGHVECAKELIKHELESTKKEDMQEAIQIAKKRGFDSMVEFITKELKII